MIPTLENAAACVLLCFVAMGALGAPDACQAGMISLVPSYFYPGTGGPGGAGDGWAAMTAAAGTIPVTAIVNPNSGPGAAADANYTTALTNLENAGGSAIAYVHTSYTGQSLATVEGQVSTYISQYGSLIKGFFVDEMTNNADSNNLAYYHSLYGYIKGLSPSYQVIGNPGSPTVPDYLNSATKGADVLVTFENNNQTSPYTSSSPASWVNSFPASDFANIVYNQSSAAGMLADVAFAAQHNVGSVFVTDQSTPNPYAQLPSYWDQEVAAVEATATPEPGMLALWTSWFLTVGVLFATKKLRGRVVTGS